MALNLKKLKEALEKATPEVLAKYVQQILKAKEAGDKATDHLKKAMESHGKIAKHSETMGKAIDGLQACVGKAIDPTLVKADLEKATLALNENIKTLDDTNGALEDEIDNLEGHLENAQGAIEDAAGEAEDEDEDGESAAEKRHARQTERMQKRHQRELTKALQASDKKHDAALREAFTGIEKMLATAIGAAPEAGVAERQVPSRASFSVEKVDDGKVAPAAAVPGAAPAVAVGAKKVLAVDPLTQMPNPEYLKMVAADPSLGNAAFEAEAKKVAPQTGNPWPDDGASELRSVLAASRK